MSHNGASGGRPQAPAQTKPGSANPYGRERRAAAAAPPPAPDRHGAQPPNAAPQSTGRRSRVIEDDEEQEAANPSAAAAAAAGPASGAKRARAPSGARMSDSHDNDGGGVEEEAEEGEGRGASATALRPKSKAGAQHVGYADLTDLADAAAPLAVGSSTRAKKSSAALTAAKKLQEQIVARKVPLVDKASALFDPDLGYLAHMPGATLHASSEERAFEIPHPRAPSSSMSESAAAAHNQKGLGICKRVVNAFYGASPSTASKAQIDALAKELWANPGLMAQLRLIQRTARELDATNAPLKKRVTAIVDEFTYQHKDTVYTIGYGLAGSGGASAASVAAYAIKVLLQTPTSLGALELEGGDAGSKHGALLKSFMLALAEGARRFPNVSGRKLVLDDHDGDDAHLYWAVDAHRVSITVLRQVARVLGMDAGARNLGANVEARAQLVAAFPELDGLASITVPDLYPHVRARIDAGIKWAKADARARDAAPAADAAVRAREPLLLWTAQAPPRARGAGAAGAAELTEEEAAVALAEAGYHAPGDSEDEG